MSHLFTLGITKKRNSKVETVFNSLFKVSFSNLKYNKPSRYVNLFAKSYSNYKKKNVSLNGAIFECIISTLFVRENIFPIYLSAKVAFVPNVKYDMLLYTSEHGPISISLKTSLRERYKQADLEAIALKYVHRKALCYLITLNENEAINVKRKIKCGDVIGLDDVIVASSKEFDKFVQNLKILNPIEPPTVKVIESSKKVTKENFDIFCSALKK